MSRQSSLKLLLCAASLLLVGTVHAAPTREELDMARTLYEQARVAQRTERWADCERSIVDAISILETPGLRFHQAYCLEQAGRWVEALGAYQRVATLLEGGFDAPDTEALLASAVNALRVRIPRLTLKTEEPAADCEFGLDGTPQSPALLRHPIPLDPGTHRIEVRCPGFLPVAREIRVEAAAAPELLIRLVPTPLTRTREGSPPSVVTERSRSLSATMFTPRRAVLLSEATLTVAGAALGTYFHVNANAVAQRLARDGDRLQSECLADLTGDACRRLSDDTRRYQQTRLGRVLSLSVTGAALAAFGVTYWLWDEAQSASHTTLRAGATASAGYAGAWLRGQF